MYQRILVPVDGCPASNRGLIEAVKLAQSTKATLKLVHVVDEFVFDPASTPVVLYEPLLQSLKVNGRKVLDEAEESVKQVGLEVESELIETIGGSVAELVLKAAERWRADLIVMGTHGRRGIRRAVLGSDAEMVLRGADVPVLLLRA
ncbi:MAG: universal stress protein [Povalibacter sp.]